MATWYGDDHAQRIVPGQKRWAILPQWQERYEKFRKATSFIWERSMLPAEFNLLAEYTKRQAL
jgi:hypothetical protein